MKSKNEIFKNIVDDLSRREMIGYINYHCSDYQLRESLNNMEDLQKKAVVSSEIESAMSRINLKVEKMITAAKVDISNLQHKKYLRKLELQLIMLRVTHSIAKNTKNKQLLLEINNQINEVFTIYRLEGGKNMFYTKKDNHELSN